MKRLLPQQATYADVKSVTSDTGEKEPKRLKVDDACTVSESSGSLWIKCGGYLLSLKDKNTLIQGYGLNDMHINVGQYLIKKHHPIINGLKSTLTISKPNYSYPEAECNLDQHFLQVIHSRHNHWIVASNIGGPKNEITVYDSLYINVEKSTQNLLQRLMKMKNVKIFVVQPQKQEGCHNCGLFFYWFVY